jgi:hypothetical protein
MQRAWSPNVGSLVVFAISAEDAAIVAPEFNRNETIFDQSQLKDIDLGKFHPAKLTDTPNHYAWARLLQNGEAAEPRLLQTALLDAQSRRRFEAVVNRSRATFMRPRRQIEAKIARFLERRGVRTEH